MAEHNGDFSEEAEYKRQQKREKMQRRRIRERIAEGRGTPEEIAAIKDFEAGYAWEMPVREAGSSSSSRSYDAGEDETGEDGEGEFHIHIPGWLKVAGVVAIFIGAIALGGRPPK